MGCVNQLNLLHAGLEKILESFFDWNGGMFDIRFHDGGNIYESGGDSRGVCAGNAVHTAPADCEICQGAL